MQLCCMGSTNKGPNKKKAPPKKKSVAPKKTAQKKVVKRDTAVQLANKQFIAKLLYTREQLPQNVVAERTGVSPNTISKWVNTFGWDNLRRRLLISKEEQLNNLYEQLEVINTEIKNSDKRRADSTQADVIAKLSKAIRTMEVDLSVADVVEVGIRFIKDQQDKITHDEMLWLTDRWNEFIQNAIRK